MFLNIGIDFSLSCPAATLHHGKTWDFKNCRFFYITNKKKSIVHLTDKLFGFHHDDLFTSSDIKPEQRFDNLSNWLMSNPIKIAKSLQEDILVTIEGYSFGSRSSNMDAIHESCGICKHKMFKSNIDFYIIPPTVIKKFATGKGNADKVMMYDAFYKDTGYDLHKILNTNSDLKNFSPTADIVDSYFIAKYGFQEYNTLIQCL